MVTIVKKLRQTVVDHDPAVEGSMDGVIRIYEQWVVDDNGVKIGQMENVSELVKGEDLVSVIGETAAKHVSQLDQTEEKLASERAEWAAKETAYQDEIQQSNLTAEQHRKDALNTSELLSRVKALLV